MSFRGIRLPIAAAGLVVALLLPVPATATANSSAGPTVELLSHGYWLDPPDGSGAVHVFGRFQNTSTTQNATRIHISYDLTGAGNPIHSVAESLVEVLGPGEIAPFDDMVPLPSGFGYTGNTLIDHSAASFSPATSQPYHNASNRPLSVSLTPCADPQPGSEQCQNQIAGTIKNVGAAAVEHVRLLLTLLNDSGDMVGVDVASAENGDSGTSLAPQEIGSFSVDRTGEPPWSGDPSNGLVVIAEPDYPIDINPSGISFGIQRVSQASSQDLTLSNSGLTAIHVSTISGGGPFSVGAGCSLIPAQSSCTVSVSFTPETTGAQTATLTITDDAAGSPQQIPLDGTGVAPLISFDPSSLDFGEQAVNTSSATKDLKVANPGTAPLVITTVNVPDNFALTSTGCGSPVAIGASCTLKLAFTPAAPGSDDGTLTVVSDALNAGETVSLQGDGAGAALSFSPQALDFSGVTLGQKLTKQVSVTNSGFGSGAGSALTIASLAISPSSGDYSKTDTCAGKSFAVGAGCVVNVTFQPSQPGQRTGTLTVLDGAGGSHLLNLSGQGAGTGANLNRSTVVFGNQAIGTASGFGTVTLTNTGAEPLTIQSITASGDFIESDNCPTSLAATGSNSCTINLRFLPKASGLRTGTLTVLDNAPGGSQTAALSGTGVALNSWESLGGFITSGPASSSWGVTRVDVFVRGGDNAIWHRFFDGTVWSGWESLGGFITTDPAAVSSAVNRIDLFVRGGDGALWTKSFANGTWGVWTSLGGKLNSAPSVASSVAGSLDVVALGADNALWHRAFRSGSWGNWESMGGRSDADPAAVAPGAGRLVVFVRGLDHALWYRIFVNGVASGNWQSLGGLLNSAPRAASATATHIDVFALGGDNALWHRAFNGALWSGWTSLGGKATANPSAAGRGAGLIDLFVRGTDFALWHRVLSGS